jgi:tetratricopeptide (TPR) repeat protein
VHTRGTSIAVELQEDVMATKRTCLLGLAAIGPLIACGATTSGDRAAAAQLTAHQCFAPATEGNAWAARELVKENEHERAVELAEVVLESCPNHGVAAAALGSALVAEQEYEEAIDRMTDVIDADHDVAEAYLWRGYGYYYVGDSERMAGDFETFLSLTPDAAEAEAVRGLLARG